MALFNRTDFERQGNTDSDIFLDSLDAMGEAIIELSGSALRSIKIFTPDMEAPLYSNDALRKKLLDFSRGNRHAQIQILAADTSSAIRQGHQLIHLSQQLTSCMEIRTTPEEYRQNGLSFVLLDRAAFIFRLEQPGTTAIQSHCKFRINRLHEFFTPAWEQAIKDPQTRRFRL